MLVSPVIVLTCLCLAAPSAQAGSQPAPTLVAQGKKSPKKVFLNFEAVELIQVIKSISKTTGKNFIVEDFVRNRKLTILSGSRVSVDEAYQAFLDALDVEGLQIEPAGKFFRIKRQRSPRLSRSRSNIPTVGITQINETTWGISRKMLEEDFTSDSSSLAVQARIVPSVKNGEIDGFKLFAIKPGSLYTSLGIKNGDTIHRINDQALTSPDTALEIYSKLRNAKTIVVELSRRGEAIKHTYELK